jgi:hypothetical protein
MERFVLKLLIKRLVSFDLLPQFAKIFASFGGLTLPGKANLPYFFTFLGLA